MNPSFKDFIKEMYVVLLFCLFVALLIMTLKGFAHSQIQDLLIKNKNIPLTFYWNYDADTNNVIGFNLHESSIQGVHDPNNICATTNDPNAREIAVPPKNKEGHYYFAATAEEVDGDLSAPSNEVHVEINFPPKSPSGLGCLPGL